MIETLSRKLRSRQFAQIYTQIVFSFNVGYKGHRTNSTLTTMAYSTRPALLPSDFGLSAPPAPSTETPPSETAEKEVKTDQPQKKKAPTKPPKSAGVEQQRAPIKRKRTLEWKA